MELNIKTFFSDYILRPWALENEKEKEHAWIASVILGVATVGVLHAGCALVKYVIVPIAEKTGITAKIDELKNRYFSDKLEETEEIAPIPKKVETKRVTNVQKKAPPPAEKPSPVPENWEKAEANLRAKVGLPFNQFCVTLIDNEEFGDHAEQAAKVFLSEPSRDPKLKITTFIDSFNKVLKTPVLSGKNPDGYVIAIRIAFFVHIHNRLPEKDFKTIQNWFALEQGLDDMHDPSEFGHWAGYNLALGALYEFENNLTR